MQSKAKQKPKPLPQLVFRASDAPRTKGKAKQEPKPLLPSTYEVRVIRASLDGGQTVGEALAACESLSPGDDVAIRTSATAGKKWHLLSVRELRRALAGESASKKLADALHLEDYGVQKILDLARRPATSLKLTGRSLGVVDDGALFVTEPRQRRGGGLESISKSFGRSAGLESLVRETLHVPSSIAPRWRDELTSQGIVVRISGGHQRAEPPDEAPPPDESPFEGEKPETDTLHWNTTFPNDASVQQARTLFTGISYLLRTGLGAEPARGSLFDTRVSAAALSPSGEPVDVSFRIEARGAGVRKAGSQDPFGESVESGTLVCRKGAGTDSFDVEVKVEKPGRVTLTLDLNAKNAYVTSQILELRALDANGPPLTAISMADLSRSRAVPIRLIVRRSNETYQLEAQVGAAGSIEPRAAALGTDDIEATILQGRDELVALSRGSYKPSGAGFAIEGGPDVMKKMMDIGRRLHRALFGKDGDSPELRDMARLLALAGKRDADGAPAPRLQIDAQLLPIPWGLVYDGQASTTPDPAGFWGMRFQIDRVVRVPISDRIERSATLEISPSTTIRPVIHPDLDKQQSVTAVQEQQAFFAARGAAPPVTSRAGLEALLRSDDPLKLLYFFCHAAVPRLNIFKPVPSMAGTTLDIDGTPLAVSDMSEMRDAPLPGSPLVFLNACSSTLGDRASQSPFVVQFVKGWAARGVVGTEWEVPTPFADLFARRALRKLLVEGKTLGDSLHEVVIEAMKEGNPFGLVYAVYAPPEIIATHPKEPIHEP